MSTSKKPAAARGELSLDFAGALSDLVGPVHGLSRDELRRAEPQVRRIIEQIESQRRQGQHRYRDLPSDPAMRRAVLAAVKRRKPGVENLVVLGIGGSALGNIALQTALNPPFYNLLPSAQRGGPRLFVMDNVDPLQIRGLLNLVGPQLKKTLFNVISKSGETAETASQFLIVRSLLEKKLGARGVAKQLIVTTDSRSGTLRELADREGYETLPVPDGVGGRFSVLSAVGLFSAAMCGIRIEKLLAGAAEMGKRVASTNVRENPAAMLAMILCQFYVRGKRQHVLMPYCDALKDLADWYRQLWAESLGKDRDLDGKPAVVGPTPIKALGATDQHSQVQLYREGPNDKVFIFVEVEKFASDVPIPRAAGSPAALRFLCGSTLGKLLNAEKQATEFALTASRRPCLTIRLPRVDESSAGQFIMLWEAATTIAGAMLHINPYDQPAVELGKQMTFALMNKPGYEKQAAEFEGYIRSRGGASV
ncbi:MAG: glucose-6-phosphate isomerase [Phycisphaerae bacterium]